MIHFYSKNSSTAGAKDRVPIMPPKTTSFNSSDFFLTLWGSSWRREGQPTPVFLPGESHGQKSLAGYSPWGHKESDTTEGLTHTTHRGVSLCGGIAPECTLFPEAPGGCINIPKFT